MAKLAAYLMNPVGRNSTELHAIASRLPSLEGLTVGLLDNTKKNADRLLKAAGEILVREYGVREVLYRRKTSSSPGASPALLDEFVKRCAAVLNAYGDCGSCTSWCIHDGVELEKRGVPTATINSDAFVALGHNEASALGLPGLPIVTVPHPMGDVGRDVVADRARAMMAQVLKVLTTDAQQLQAAYTERLIVETDGFASSGMVCPL